MHLYRARTNPIPANFFPRSTRSPARCAATRLPSTGVNKEIGRRADVVRIFPNDASAIRLTAALLSEQNDERLVPSRYLSVESMALILADTEQPEHAEQKPPSLHAA
jgi:transposase-like protein